MLIVKTVESIFFAAISSVNMWNPTDNKSIAIVTYANHFVDSRLALSFMFSPYDHVRIPRSVIGQWV